MGQIACEKGLLDKEKAERKSICIRSALLKFYNIIWGAFQNGT